MVLQRGAPVPVWGWADAGEQVTVSFAGQEVSAAPGADGKWMVKLAPLKVGEPGTMLVKGKNTVTIQDVLVGEVWLGGGQSNMDFALGWQGEENLAAVPTFNDPLLRYFDVPHKGSLEPESDVSARWQLATPGNAKGWSAIGAYFGRDLREKLGVPVAFIKSSYGGTPAAPWVSQEVLARDPAWKAAAEKETAAVRNLPASRMGFPAENPKALDSRWKYQASAPFAPVSPAAVAALPPTPTASLQNTSTALYNAMIHPLIPYAFRGCLWYQGESNTNPAEQALNYRKLLPALVGDWRALWDAGNFPFYIVQLANYGAVQAQPGESNWATLRESQNAAAAALPHSGVAVLIDIGEGDNIHLHNKTEAARRLTLLALHRTYSQPVEDSGPCYRDMKVEGGAVRISFTGVAGGLEARSGPIKRFAVAGADKRFVWADAKIEGDAVVVSSPQVANPVAARYAWADNPADCNLYNKQNLPPRPSARTRPGSSRLARRPGITHKERSAAPRRRDEEAAAVIFCL